MLPVIRRANHILNLKQGRESFNILPDGERIVILSGDYLRFTK